FKCNLRAYVPCETQLTVGSCEFPRQARFSALVSKTDQIRGSFPSSKKFEQRNLGQTSRFILTDSK
ncbi:hypothetical protein ACTXJU_17160, partial [Glutamicibacter ardleyensis]|uniref:hypothetical protein n=1 Tax=Glutamicibacter ardleyensis TaxID=225894 RepID=UPI003FB873C1